MSVDISKTRHVAIGYVAAIITIVSFVVGIISFLGWWLGDEWRKAYSNIAIINGAYFSVILFILYFFLSKKTPDFLGIPRVRLISGKDLIIVEGAPWLSLGVTTAIYVLEGEFERIVCAGEVINVQTNGLVQIQIREADLAYGSLEVATQALGSMSKENILVRPGLFRRIGE